MAKIGKFSTGIKGSPKNAGSPYGMSNKGWDQRKNMTSTMMDMEPRQKPRDAYVGAANETKAKLPRSKF
jgi:hypothetical protein